MGAGMVNDHDNTPKPRREYSFGEDYGKDLLVDLDVMVNTQGTGCLMRDLLERSFKEISRLRKQLKK